MKVTILRRLRQRKLIFNVNDNIHFIRLVGIVWHSRFMHPLWKTGPKGGTIVFSFLGIEIKEKEFKVV